MATKQMPQPRGRPVVCPRLAEREQRDWLRAELKERFVLLWLGTRWERSSAVLGSPKALAIRQWDLKAHAWMLLAPWRVWFGRAA